MGSLNWRLRAAQKNAASHTPPANTVAAIRNSKLSTYFSLIAFSVTEMEDADIAIAAANGVARPRNATGTAIKL